MPESPDPRDDGGSRDEPAGPDKKPETEAGPRVSRIRVGDADILVLSVPLPKLCYPEGTTSAEHEIIDLVLQGLTPKEIAVERGASLRTVTTQLGTIFRKAHVNSQTELISTMTGNQKPEDD
ncbi:MAG: helix-turn-helix transcriptional regulator [Myxococcales bacterium]|nr:helix-turn-helix transcriptional regulator [Myxococcales bacterium]MDH3483830.1 helix-turn-helix transcriptional regulator [Myxococcales bacterium]